MPDKNKLYYGDNYDVLRLYVKDESVDLVYLDPPFNSRQDYSVFFAEKDGSKSSAQIHAFEDTWTWNLEAERSYQHIVENIGGHGRPAQSPSCSPPVDAPLRMWCTQATNSGGTR